MIGRMIMKPTQGLTLLTTSIVLKKLVAIIVNSNHKVKMRSEVILKIINSHFNANFVHFLPKQRKVSMNTDIYIKQKSFQTLCMCVQSVLTPFQYWAKNCNAVNAISFTTNNAQIEKGKEEGVLKVGNVSCVSAANQT